MTSNKIIVTGCTGLIGNELMRQLDQHGGFEATGLGRKTNAKNSILKVDLAEDWDFNSLPEKADVIIHLAQSEKFRDFPESSEEVFRVNTLSTLKLLEYARKSGAKKFIYASSGGIYGNSNKGFDEKEPVVANKDLGFYLSTKFCSEILVESYSKLFNTIILRFFFVYGKDQRKSMLIPRLVENIRNGNPITLQGENGITINPIHVSDSAKAIIKAIGLSSNHKINVAGAEELSLKEICECIAGKLNKKAVYSIQNEEPKNLIGDTKKMRELLWKPGITFNEGINDLI